MSIGEVTNLDEQCMAAATELYRTQPLVGSLKELADIIRKHVAPAEVEAGPKCLDCGAKIKTMKFDGGYMAHCSVNMGHTYGPERPTESEAIAAYARLTVRESKADQPTPAVSLPPCCLCGKPPRVCSVAGKTAECENNLCYLAGIWVPLSDWRRLHAPNRLTLKYPRADSLMGDRWWPVALNNYCIMALFTHRGDAADYAAKADYHSVLDPINVEVTVKP